MDGRSDDAGIVVAAGRNGVQDRLVAVGTATALDGIASLIADVVDADVATVTVLSDDREFLIGTSGAVSLPAESGAPLPLEGSMCRVVREQGAPVTSDDLDQDPRFADGQLQRRLGVRAYAGAPIHGPDGDIVGAVCAGSATPRHWRASDQHALEAMARFAGRELGRLLDTTAALERAAELALVVGRLRHELSSDLTVVLGGIETALHPSASAEIRIQALTNARSDALRVIDVMDALLKTDARTSIRGRVMTLPEIVGDATRALDEVTRGRLEVACDDARIEVAGRLLTRVLANLVDNALKHTHGRVRVTATAGDEVVTLAVGDDGPGFRPDALDQLYTPFAAGQHRTDDAGFGLGLFIVRELVHRLGGSIEVDSAPTGSTVTVLAPAQVLGDLAAV